MAALAALTLALAACSTESGPENGQNPLRPKGTYAKDIDNLFTPIFWVAVAVGVFILGATIFVAVRFRHRKGADDRPKQLHGNTPLEIGWTLIPALILAVIAVPTVALIFDLAEEPANPLEVTVVGKQWWWQFDYGKQAGIDRKIVTADELHIPTGRDVKLKLEACDDSLGTTGTRPNCNVIHSFWVPELTGKRDVVPGLHNTMKLRTDRPGTYLGQCAEYCGLSHANMRFRVIAQSPDEFQQWVDGQVEGPAVPLSDAGEATGLFTKKFQCTNCHTTEDSSISVYGPNLTHLASRTTFASGYYELTRANLVRWILNAPSMIPMESENCRLPERPMCVGMPSFTEDTPPGYPVMTRAEAEALADYLLELK
ncbi:MAG TPA: cytochrome c oxidase subunit II [Acidimicrobiia bacterium]